MYSISDIQQIVQNAETEQQRQSYDRSISLYKQAIGILFNFEKQMQRPEQKSSIRNMIANLLSRAENCQQLRDSQQTVQRPRTLPAVQAGNNVLEQMIEQEIIDRSPAVQWEHIAGLQNAKTILQEAVIMPSQYPHLFTGLRAPPRGILLFGPPGTGKTMLAKALATECQATFFNVSSATLTSKFFGEAEKLVRALFNVARLRQPSIIFIDEIDSMLGARSEGQHDASRRLQTEFLVQMDGVGNSEQDRVILIGATNRPQELDEAIRRRFSKRVLIDLPTKSARVDLVSNLLQGTPHKLGKRDINWIASHTENYSGSDLAAVCREAAMIPLRGISQERLAAGAIPPLSKKDFERAIRNVPRTVSAQSLSFYQRWNQEYGSHV